MLQNQSISIVVHEHFLSSGTAVVPGNVIVMERNDARIVRDHVKSVTKTRRIGEIANVVRSLAIQNDRGTKRTRIVVGSGPRSVSVQGIGIANVTVNAIAVDVVRVIILRIVSAQAVIENIAVAVAVETTEG